MSILHERYLLQINDYNWHFIYTWIPDTYSQMCCDLLPLHSNYFKFKSMRTINIFTWTENSSWCFFWQTERERERANGKSSGKHWSNLCTNIPSNIQSLLCVQIGGLSMENVCSWSFGNFSKVFDQLGSAVACQTSDTNNYGSLYLMKVGAHRCLTYFGRALFVDANAKVQPNLPNLYENQSSRGIGEKEANFSRTA